MTYAFFTTILVVRGIIAGSPTRIPTVCAGW